MVWVTFVSAGGKCDQNPTWTFPVTIIKGPVSAVYQTDHRWLCTLVLVRMQLINWGTMTKF